MVKIKNINKNKLRFDYKNNPSLKGYFNWKLNQFLGFFSEYGTSPIRALIISIWVILAFSLFYFLSYQDNSKSMRKKNNVRFNNLIKYFSSYLTLNDLYISKKQNDIKSYKEFEGVFINEKKNIPFFIRILGKPLYKISSIRLALISKSLKKGEVLTGKWEDLTKKSKSLKRAL